MSSTSKGRNLTPQNNTFFVDSSHTDKDNDESLHEDTQQDRTEKARNNISSSAAVLDESDSFCCDASSQLLGNKILYIILYN